MSEKPKKKAKSKYRSAESRARQLAGLRGVKIEDHVMLENPEEFKKVNGGGLLAGVSDEKKQQVLELFAKGHSCRFIEDKVGLSRQTVDSIKVHQMDMDAGFRLAYYNSQIKRKLAAVVEGSLDRVNELMPEMSAKDAVLAMGISIDKMNAMDKQTPDQLHQHIHIHGAADITKMFSDAIRK